MEFSVWILPTVFKKFLPYFEVGNIGDALAGFGEDEEMIISTSTITANTWIHIAGTYDGSYLRIYINGVLNNTKALSGFIMGTQFTQPTHIGINNPASNETFTGKIDDVRIYNYARTPAQIIEDMNAGHPAPGSPVGSAYLNWKLDAGYNTIANNSGYGGSVINGTISNGTWTNNGKYGKAITFASNTSISTTIADPGNTNTLSLWVYPTTSIASKTLITTDKLSTDGSSRPVYGGCTGTALSLNTWTHILAVSNGSGSCAIYQNGIQTSTGSTGVSFGTSFNAGNSSFTGTIDEIKLYALAFTSDQAKTEYNQGSMAVMGALSTSYDSGAYNASWSANDEYCPPGQGSACVPPVGHWKMDENTGTANNDSSGNNNNGSLTGSPDWRNCKFGSCMWFSQNNHFVVPHNSIINPTETLTYSAWIKYDPNSPLNHTKFVLGKDGAASDDSAFDITAFKDSGGNKYTSCSLSNNGSTSYSTSFTGPYLTDDWHYITCTYDNETLKMYVDGVYNSENTTPSGDVFLTTADLAIGTLYAGMTGASAFYGGVDDVKIYNYARTPAQIAWDYNRGGPVGWWKMDENTGTDIFDSSGQGNSGTLTNSPSWTDGKFNYGLNFSNSNDYSTVTHNSTFDFGANQDFAVSAWVKSSQTAALNTWPIILSKEDGSATRQGYALILHNSNDDSRWFFEIFVFGTSYKCYGTKDIADGNWHHILGIRSGSNLIVYEDGRNAGTCAASSGSVSKNAPLRFGNSAAASPGSAGDLNGILDDIRIYSYALTSQQVKLIMNEGAATRFAPITGQP
jgi:hypothetical protein